MKYFRYLLNYCAAIIIIELFLAKESVYCQTTPEKSGSRHKPNIVTSPTIDLRQTGLRIYKPEKCYDGYVLFCYLTTRDKMFTTIYLIDMEGNIVHEWVVPPPATFARLMPHGTIMYPTSEGPAPERSSPGEIYGLRELDYNSNVIWFYPGFIHHDFQLAGDGNIIVSREELVYAPQPDASQNPYMISPRIEIITREKEIIWCWKAEEHIKEMEELTGIKIYPFKKGAYAPEPEGDWLHNNTCAILPDNPAAKKDPRFRKGNVVFCSFHLDIIGVIDYQTKEVVWAWGPGVVEGPHSPVMLDNGNFLVFDNGRYRKWSRVIEVDPLTGEIVWEYHAEPKESFFDCALSNAIRLPNNNTLICEGEHNRFFEITSDGEIVWDYIPTFNTTRGGNGILRIEKYSPQYIEPLLKAIKK